MSDVDILVSPRELRQAILLLQQLGFESPNRTLEFIKKGEILLRIDLHDRLWFFDAKKLWRSVAAKKEGSRLRILSPEYNLLHILLHTLLQDGFVSETALDDGKGLLQYYRQAWSWERFTALAREEGWSKTAAIYLRELAKQEPGLVPSKILLQDDTFVIRDRGNSYSRMIWAQEKFWKRIQLIWFILFPSLGFLKWRYSFVPSFLVWLLPLVRCVDLAWKGMLTYSHAETKR